MKTQHINKIHKNKNSLFLGQPSSNFVCYENANRKTEYIFKLYNVTHLSIPFIILTV